MSYKSSKFLHYLNFKKCPIAVYDTVKDRKKLIKEQAETIKAELKLAKGAQKQLKKRNSKIYKLMKKEKKYTPESFSTLVSYDEQFTDLKKIIDDKVDELKEIMKITKSLIKDYGSIPRKTKTKDPKTVFETPFFVECEERLNQHQATVNDSIEESEDDLNKFRKLEEEYKSFKIEYNPKPAKAKGKWRFRRAPKNSSSEL